MVVVADVVLRHLGGTPSDFSLFLGRMHPLAVHLPIGIVLLVGAAEAVTLSARLRPRLDPAIALALPVLRHRVLTNYQAESDGMSVDKILIDLLDNQLRNGARA